MQLDWTPRALAQTRHTIAASGNNGRAPYAVIREYLDGTTSPSVVVGVFASEQRAAHVLSLYLNPWLLWG